MSKLRRVIAVSSLLMTLVVLGNVPALYAQAVSIASVTGRVVDEQGASVSGAQIKITAVDIGVVYNAVSNSDGLYTFPSLPIGAYTVSYTHLDVYKRQGPTQLHFAGVVFEINRVPIAAQNPTEDCS